jgi:mRNA capping enzyme
MFALHYFFSSESSARNAIKLAANNLKPGGYFFGVLPDGKNVMDTLGPTMQVSLLPRCVAEQLTVERTSTLIAKRAYDSSTHKHQA